MGLFMNKFYKLLSLIFALVFVLCACSSSLVTLKYENGQMINSWSGLKYNAAPLNYQPFSVGEPYALYKKGNLTLYEIEGLDPKKWLTEEYSGGLTTVFYNPSETLPSLAEMEATKVYICYEDEVTYAVAEINDGEVINKLIDLYVNGEHEEWPMLDSIQTFELKFYSENKYPHLYFNLTYGEFSSGKYLYDSTTKRSVNIGNLIDEYLE